MLTGSTLFWAGLFVIGLFALATAAGFGGAFGTIALAVIGIWAILCAILGLTGR